MINSEVFKGVKDIYDYGLRTTYKNGLKFEYVPYKVFSFEYDGLTASAGENVGNFKGMNKGLNKFYQNGEIKVDDWILSVNGDLVKVVSLDNNVVKVFNGCWEYTLDLNEIDEVFNGN